MAMDTNFITALGAGSGVDVKSLAQSLVDVEKAPRQSAIEDKISRSEARISGYAVVMAALDNVRSAFSGLNDRSDFNTLSATNSQPTAFAVETTTDALPGQHSLEVVALATGQRSVSEGFGSATELLNGGNAFSLVLSDADGVAQTIRVAGATSEQQILAFSGAVSAGTFTVAGVSVAVAAGDSASTVAGKVKAALEADSFITGNAGRSITNNNDGSITINFSLDDENAETIVIAGEEDLGIEAAGATLQAYSTGGTTPQGVVDAINAAAEASAMGVTAFLLDTGDGDAPFKVVLSGAVGTDNSFSLTSDDGSSGIGEEQTISFAAASVGGTLNIGGVSVLVAAGDTADDVAARARTALAASSLITGVPGRTVVDNGDGTISIQFIAGDGNMDTLAVSDPDNTGADPSVSTTQVFVAGASVENEDGAKLFFTPTVAAEDAHVRVNGIDVYRQTNTISDVIAGVSLTLSAPTTGAATLSLARDTSTVKEKLQAVVKAYNDMASDFKILTGPKSEDEEDIFSGSLYGDSTVRNILAQVRSVMLADSSTPGEELTALRDLGISIDRNGVITLDEEALDDAVVNHFDDVVKLLSANTNEQSNFGVANRGVAGDMVKRITDLISQRGVIMSQSESAEQQVDRYKEDLAVLEERMKALLERYTNQFAVMESLVGQMTSMRESLKGTFENLSAMYSNK
jgi:flagellar hook-associated protein 2